LGLLDGIVRAELDRSGQIARRAGKLLLGHEVPFSGLDGQGGISDTFLGLTDPVDVARLEAHGRICQIGLVLIRIVAGADLKNISIVIAGQG
jgi:hypothetical protein